MRQRARDKEQALHFLLQGAVFSGNALLTMNIQPWDRRPKAPCGDTSEHPIFCAVGLALTLWEKTESEISVAYIGLISEEEWRANKYFNTPGFESRHKLIRKAIETNVNGKDCTGFGEFMDMVLNYSKRRHEIAHGQVYNLEEDGFYLAPNNTLSRNFPNGAAIYQYTSADINYFCGEFDRLAKAAEPFARRLARR
jgi:hypothetical protein